MKILMSIVLCSIFSFIGFGIAEARCELTISSFGQTKIHNYSGFDSEPAFEPIRLLISNTGTTICAGRIAFKVGNGDGMMRSSHGETISFNITDNRSLNRILFDSRLRSIGEMTVNIGAGEQVELNPLVVVPAYQAGRSGLYETEVEVVYKNSDMSDLDQSTILSIVTDVTAAVQASFVGISSSSTDRRPQLNLGELYPGLNKRFGLNLRANTDVDVQVLSENGGYLRRNGETGAKIAYDMSIANRKLSLDQQSQIVLPAELSREGTRNPVEITIGSFSNVEAGDYSDTIQIRISAR